MSELLSDDEMVAIASDWETGNSEECRTIRALLAHISALTKQVEEARSRAEPFVSFARFAVDEHGWVDSYGKERISTWFGPSDFRAIGLSTASDAENKP
jgi:hypothetical protein